MLYLITVRTLWILISYHTELVHVEVEETVGLAAIFKYYDYVVGLLEVFKVHF